MYRIRRQRWTGKLILQVELGGGWTDSLAWPNLLWEFAIVDPAELAQLRTLADRGRAAERRAEGQRKANAARAALIATLRPPE